MPRMDNMTWISSYVVANWQNKENGHSKVEDYETESKMHVDTKYRQEKMAAASILTSSCYQVSQ